MYDLTDNRQLYHYGIKGMKWGVRRYQNYDGTLTSAGKQRRGLNQKQKNTLKKAAIIGAAVAGTALMVYGGYKLNKFIGDKNYANNMKLAMAAAEKIRDKMVDAAVTDDSNPADTMLNKYSRYLLDLKEDTTNRMYSSVSRRKGWSPDSFVENFKPMTPDEYRAVLKKYNPWRYS